ncbi:MAG: penicillin-binding protein 2 [Proteobacteria bacterium]|nr:penicillin-binding protein 2 [Pseudomonadota bacterium]
MINKDTSFLKLQNINRRMFIIIAAKVIVFTGIVGRLFTLQINESKKYLTLSDKNRVREWKLPPERGEFYDYFGKLIAGNQKVYQLHLIPEQVENFKSLSARLKNILELSDDEYSRILKKKDEIKPWETLIVSENLDWKQFAKVNNYLHELTGVKPVLSVSRYYPYKENLTHIIGYVNQATVEDLENSEQIKSKFVPGLKVGKTGLEKTFENELIGTNSIERYEVNAYGKRISQLEFQKGDKGKNIKLTIDADIQNLCNQLLANKAGSISIMNIFSGEIIAMHSSPSFDPNLFLFGINQDDWQLIRNNPMNPLVNKTISGQYSPGSTIKPIVALSALENKIINKDFKVFCKGKIESYGQTYHCWKKEGHGSVDLKEAMKQSCDTYFYEISRLLGVDRLSVTAKKFGLGNKIVENLFDNEKNGLIPSTQWKKNNLGKNWLLGETMITGIGQGYIQATPLQLCLMTAQIANGGYKIQPKIIVDNKKQNLLPESSEALFQDQKNIKLIQETMFSSVNEVRGTSYSSRISDPKYQFAGKTGTAQVKRITKLDRELDLDTAEIPYEERDHALYIAFGPYKSPQYAMSIIVEHGGSGSSAAAPIAKELFKMVIDKHELREKLKEKNLLDI